MAGTLARRFCARWAPVDGRKSKHDRRFLALPSGCFIWGPLSDLSLQGRLQPLPLYNERQLRGTFISADTSSPPAGRSGRELWIEGLDRPVIGRKPWILQSHSSRTQGRPRALMHAPREKKNHSEQSATSKWVQRLMPELRTPELGAGEPCLLSQHPQICCAIYPSWFTLLLFREAFMTEASVLMLFLQTDILKDCFPNLDTHTHNRMRARAHTHTHTHTLANLPKLFYFCFCWMFSTSLLVPLRPVLNWGVYLPQDWRSLKKAVMTWLLAVLYEALRVNHWWL